MYLCEKIYIKMNRFILKSPSPIQMELGLEITLKDAYTQITNLKLEVPCIISILETSDRAPLNGGKISLNIYNEDLALLKNKNLILLLACIESSLGVCARLGERLFEDLRSLNDLFYQEKIVKQYFWNKYHKKLYEEKCSVCADNFVDDECFNSEYAKSYKKLDFMGHRDLLSYLLDKNILKGKNIVCPKYQPNIMKVFCQFILDRNKYTHGRLIYVPSLKRTVLRFMEDQEKVIGIVDLDTMQSFVNCYNLLFDFLRDLRKIERPE
jgi:hypothetical protein|nr:MAG TPA: hypothetical protein [Caudoviricetes sp.]